VTCKTCGLPEAAIKVLVERRKWGKSVTIIDGIDSREIDLGGLAKKLKSKMATGGTAKEGRIELQGDHLYPVKDFLVKEGFSEDQIDLTAAPPRKRRGRRY
jgi:translation initiation factor 1